MENNNNNNGVLYTPPIPNHTAAAPAQQMTYTPYVPVKKEYKPFDKKDTLFLVFTLLAAFLMVDFAVFHGFNIGFTIAYLVLFAVTTAYLWKKAEKKPLFSLCCGALSLAGSVTFALFDNKLINAIMFFLVFGLYGFYVLGISAMFRRPQGSFKSLIDLFESVFVHTFGGLEKAFGSAKATSHKNKKLINAFIGIGVAVPFLLVIIPLLVQSDAAFEGLIKKLGENIGIYLLELALAVFVTPFLFSYLFSKKETPAAPEDFKKSRFITPTISISFLSVISVTYLVYLFSQLAYLFSAFKGILPDDYHYTASAFARRGFYEMFVICIINVAIISLVGIFTKRLKGRVSPAIKVLSSFISLFSVLLIATAMQKMKLNISIYGLSVNRVLVCTLMVMLLVMITFFILHIFAPKISYLQPIILICSAMFVALSFANIDARCADYNIKAYQSGKIETLDTVSIRKSSDSAIPYLIDLAKSEDEVISNSAKTQLSLYINNNGYLELEKKLDKYTGVKIDSDVFDFRRYNKARNDAYTMLRDYYASLDESGRAPINELDRMYREYSYEDWDDVFIDSSNDEYGLYYYYNPKTGLYDKVKKEAW